MRADRLLALMLTLQGRGKMTAKALAEDLGVSRRTILRDVEALSIAGVPIYSEGGHGGGIALDEQYRTTLTGLHAPEVQTLFIASNSAALRDVGLSEASELLLLKLFAALPAAHRPTVDHIRQRLLIDPAWWWSEATTPPFWDELQRAVYEDRVIAVRYEHYQGEVVERVLEPYSLVSKSSVWYLVAARDGELRTYRVARIHALQVLDRGFIRQGSYDLAKYWTEHLQSFTENFAEYRCTLRVHPERVAFIKWLLPGRWRALDDGDSEGWVAFRLLLDSLPMAKMVVYGLGAQSLVIDPPELSAAVRDDAEALLRHLGDTESRYNPPVTSD
ncbi:MAG: WYL domain-containing protein [Chloroflexi bacterium]|nr:WYL domain-containing protein [Chloroflexota bacterium]